MIRRPTPVFELYRWHRDALAGRAPAIHDGEPHCGWFKTRAVKGGPWMAARIWCERDIDPETGELTGPEELRCDVDGMFRDPARAWLSLAHNPISRAEYDALLHRRNLIPAMQEPHKAIDLSAAAMRP